MNDRRSVLKPHGMRMAGAERWRWQCVRGTYLLGTLVAGAVGLTGAVPADAREEQYVLYKVLADHPACTGPGHIAYEVTLDLELEKAGIIRGADVPGACLVTVRRANTLMEIPVPCPEESQKTLPEDLSWTNFCRLTEDLRPATVRLQGSLIGCITVTGHRFVDGAWTATAERPEGPSVTQGRHDDPRLEVNYSSGPFGTPGFGEPSLRIWVRLADEVLAALPGVTVEFAGSTGALTRVRMVDGSISGCAENPASCWTPPPAQEIRAEKDEIWSVCSADPEAFPNYGIERDAPATGDE